MCPQCEHCSKGFDFLNRRHHCRRCGKCFCSSCCGQKHPLPRMCFVDPVLQCNQCIGLSKKESDFFEKHLKILVNGAQYEVESTVFIAALEPSATHVYMCKLSNDQRTINMLCISSNVESYDPIELQQIESMQILTSGNETPGGGTVSGLSIRYKDSEGVMQTLKLLLAAASSSDNKKQALAFIGALKQALKMVFENRKMSNIS